MKNKKFHGFTLSPKIMEEFKTYAKEKGSSTSYEVERLIREELNKGQLKELPNQIEKK